MLWALAVTVRVSTAEGVPQAVYLASRQVIDLALAAPLQASTWGLREDPAPRDLFHHDVH